MVISRLAIASAAAFAVLCASPVATPRASVLVVYDSHQARRSLLLDCTHCEAFDVAAGGLPSRSYEAVALDGHSLPPGQVIGTSLDRIAAVLERAEPRLIVALTCYGAELHLLDRLFAASPRAETVMASAESLPWPGSSVDDTCLARRGASPACFHVPGAVQTFSREDVARLDAQAKDDLASVRACRAPPRFARHRPLYLCIEGDAAAVLEVSFDEIERDCRPQVLEDLRVVRCGVRDDAHPLGAAAAR
jgi:hypothetical protein